MVAFSLITAAAVYYMLDRADKQGAGISDVVGVLSDEGISPEDMSSLLEMITGDSGGQNESAAKEIIERIFNWEDSKVVGAYKINKMVSEVEDAPPDAGALPEELSSVLNATSEAGDIRMDNTEGDIKGRIVLLDNLKVHRVDRYENGYSLVTSGTPDRPGTMLKVYGFHLSTEDKTYIEGLKEGDLITAKGRVSGTFSGPSSSYIALDPAVIIR
jgi:hypothetical protein